MAKPKPMQRPTQSGGNVTSPAAPTTPKSRATTATKSSPVAAVPPDAPPGAGQGIKPLSPGGDMGMSERDEMIRQAAYERFRQRGGAPGSAEADWLAAEAAIDTPGPQTSEERQKA